MARLRLEELIAQLAELESLELEKVQVDVEELVLELQRSIVMPIARAQKADHARRAPLVFEPPLGSYKGSIANVQLGATKAAAAE